MKLGPDDKLEVISQIGTLVRVTAIFHDPDEAKRYMDENADDSVVIVKPPYIFLANVKDLGYRPNKVNEKVKEIGLMLKSLADEAHACPWLQSDSDKVKEGGSESFRCGTCSERMDTDITGLFCSNTKCKASSYYDESADGL